MRAGTIAIALASAVTVVCIAVAGCGSRPAVSPSASSRPAASQSKRSSVTTPVPPIRDGGWDAPLVASTEASIPNVIGMFDDDALAAFKSVGFPLRAGARYYLKHWGIVVSQRPAAGTFVKAGTAVGFRAEFPHQKSGVSRAVARVHGPFYLRYGIEAGGVCRQCHSAKSCVRSGCHDSKPFQAIRKGM